MTWEQFAKDLVAIPEGAPLPKHGVLDTEKFNILRTLSFFKAFGDAELGELIPDADAVSPLDVVADRMRREQIEHVLASLDGREQRVLRLRFGLDDGHARTLEEVGREFGLTRERIRQIEVQALRKLRHPSRSRKLREFAA